MPRTRASFLLLGLLFAAVTGAAPEHAPWPGGIAVIDVGPAEAPRPIVEFDARRVLVTRNGDRWLAAVGIPLDTEPRHPYPALRERKFSPGHSSI